MRKTNSEFRKALYQNFIRRADNLFNLVDALMVAGHVSSPVALREETPFARKFSSVNDGLENGEMNMDDLLSMLPHCFQTDSETIAGYKVYATDATDNEHEQAETLPDGSVLKSIQKDPIRYGHKYSWLVRLLNFGTSWAAPVDVERIDTEMTDTLEAAFQVQELVIRDPQKKVLVADSRYADQLFLGIFRWFQNIFALVRIASNRVLYENPKPKPASKKGRPSKHGKSFHLNKTHRSAERTETFELGKQTVHVSLWQNLHFKKLADLIGSLVQVEFLKEGRWNTTLQTSDLVILDGTEGCRLARSLPYVFMAFCHRAHVPLFETAWVSIATVPPIWSARNNGCGCVRWRIGNCC